MDVYLKEKDSKRAALVAHEVMLQEYDKNELTLTASLLSCMKYLSEKHEDDSNVQESKESSDDGQKKVIKHTPDLEISCLLIYIF